MKKLSLNLVIDMLLFLCLSVIAGIGFLIKYVLITGQETWVKYGENIQLEFLGIDRHEWGKIHLIVGIVMLFLLVLHIVFHWQLVKSMIKKVFGISVVNTSLVIIFIVICFLFIFAPFLVVPDKTNKAHDGMHHKFENKNHRHERGGRSSQINYK